METATATIHTNSAYKTTKQVKKSNFNLAFDSKNPLVGIKKEKIILKKPVKNRAFLRGFYLKPEIYEKLDDLHYDTRIDYSDIVNEMLEFAINSVIVEE
jgi:Ribbon-helix-helix domain